VELQLSSMTVGVVGAGVMGSGIAQSLAVAGVGRVVCVDVSAEAVANAEVQVTSGRYGLGRAVELGLITDEVAERARGAMTFATDRTSMRHADVVVEAIYEDIGAKIRLLRDLDGELDRATVMASNTSGLSITALAAATDRPDRVIGWHWASPAVIQRMAEIVTSADTSQATVDLIIELARACGKNPVVVKDTQSAWGFVANRIFRAARLEAERLVGEGITDEAGVDRLMKDCFRWPAGPFELTGGARSNWSDS
jgi:3-hydroxybutyryl-CoA dehydrogenase